MNKLYAAWIWFWRNDMTRLFVVVIPTFLIVVLPVFYFLGVRGEDLYTVATVLWAMGIVWALVESDFSNTLAIDAAPCHWSLQDEPDSER